MDTRDKGGFESLASALRRQKEYSDLFFDPSELTEAEKEEYTKTFALALHAEVSGLVSAVNFKDHRKSRSPVDQHKLLYKSVDAFRYVLALLNLWEITPEDFVAACEDKDMFLHQRHAEQAEVPPGVPVVIFDIDDVLGEFRRDFFSWLRVTYGVNPDPNDKQYYSKAEIQRTGHKAEDVFSAFISDSGFRRLSVNETAFSAMRMCKEAGYWVQILTARPSHNLKCFYDTHRWLYNIGATYDSLVFSPEKYLWLTGQRFYKEGQLVCALDDSAKHATEYARHGVPTIVPVKSYNGETEGEKNITRVDFDAMTPDALFGLIQNLEEKVS